MAIVFKTRVEFIHLKQFLLTQKIVLPVNDGSVLAWGMEIFGGKIPHFIQNQLKNVKMVFSTDAAFAALLNDSSVLAWGDDMFGGEIPTHFQNKLIKNVKMIFPHKFGFTAVCKNGELIEWGEN